MANIRKRGWVKSESGWKPLDERAKQILCQIRAGRRFREIAEQFGISTFGCLRFAIVPGFRGAVSRLNPLRINQRPHSSAAPENPRPNALNIWA